MGQNKKLKTSSIADMEIAMCRDMIDKITTARSTATAIIALAQECKSALLVQLPTFTQPARGLTPRKAQFNHYSTMVAQYDEIGHHVRGISMLTDHYERELQQVIDQRAVGYVLVNKLRTHINSISKELEELPSTLNSLKELRVLIQNL